MSRARYVSRSAPSSLARAGDQAPKGTWLDTDNNLCLVPDVSVDMGPDFIETGLLWPDGNPICRVREQIGFLVDYGDGFKPRYEYDEEDEQPLPSD